MLQNEIIDSYLSILRTWNKKINLVQTDTLQSAFERHIKDSMQICDMLDKNDLIVDIGSGAGLPGVVLSICGFKNVVLCEKNFKKSVFLKTVKSKLNLNFDVFNDDIYNFSKIQNAPRGAFENCVAVSRAFGSLKLLLDVMCSINISKGVFHKGEKINEEINEALHEFEFDYSLVKSVTSDNGVIITVSEIRRK